MAKEALAGWRCRGRWPELSSWYPCCLLRAEVKHCWSKDGKATVKPCEWVAPSCPYLCVRACRQKPQKLLSVMWWGEERTTCSRQQPFGQAAEGMGTGFRGAGSHKRFQSMAEMRQGCQVCHLKGFLVLCWWRLVGEELG